MHKKSRQRGPTAQVEVAREGDTRRTAKVRFAHTKSPNANNSHVAIVAPGSGLVSRGRHRNQGILARKSWLKSQNGRESGMPLIRARSWCGFGGYGVEESASNRTSVPFDLEVLVPSGRNVIVRFADGPVKKVTATWYFFEAEYVSIVLTSLPLT